jgi:hypothetical protein
LAQRRSAWATSKRCLRSLGISRQKPHLRGYPCHLRSKSGAVRNRDLLLIGWCLSARISSCRPLHTSAATENPMAPGLRVPLFSVQ